MHPFWPHRSVLHTQVDPEQCAARISDLIGASPETPLSAEPSAFSANPDEPVLIIPNLWWAPRRVSSRWPLMGWATRDGFQVSAQPRWYRKGLPQQTWAKTWALGTLVRTPTGTAVTVTLWVLPSVVTAWALIGLVAPLIIGALVIVLRAFGVFVAPDVVPPLLMGALALPLILVVPFLVGRLLAWDQGPWLLALLRQVLGEPLQQEKRAQQPRQAS